METPKHEKQQLTFRVLDRIRTFCVHVSCSWRLQRRRVQSFLPPRLSEHIDRNFRVIFESRGNNITFSPGFSGALLSFNNHNLLVVASLVLIRKQRQHHHVFRNAVYNSGATTLCGRTERAASVAVVKERLFLGKLRR